MTVREVKEELGISHGTAGRLRQRAEESGLLGEIRDDDRENENSAEGHSLPN
jgi:hypothetical protein